MNQETKNKIEAALFDFEGTLVDFQWNLQGAIEEVVNMLVEAGFPREPFQGRKYSVLMKAAMEAAPSLGHAPEKIREKIGAIYDRYDEDALTRWGLRPGALDFLHTIKSRGVKTGLISNVGRQALGKAFEKLGLQNCFDILITRNDVRRLKPSGEGLLLALERLQVQKDRAFFMGDSLDDIYAARDAGLRVVIIFGGENPNQELLAAGPDRCIREFKELSAWIDEYFS